MINRIKNYFSRDKRVSNLASFIHPKNEDRIVKLLGEIPSETSLSERLLLYWLAVTYGDKGHIVELGPFLGGTTRALALGLEDNMMAQKKKVITIDRFEEYYKGEVLKKMNVLGAESFKNDELVPFLPVFKSYHESHSYNKNIEVIIAAVPDLPTKDWSLELGIGNDSVGILFIDGCKSWFSTKAFMISMIKKIQIGSFVIFQDYGRFTCFWLPVFCVYFSDYFKHVGNIDSTFVFRYVGGLDEEIIDNRFPDEPAETNPEVVQSLFNDLIAGGETTLQKVIYAIQLNAYKAYRGNLTGAKAGLLELKRNTAQESRAYRLINQALESPTYTPEGSILLD